MKFFAIIALLLCSQHVYCMDEEDGAIEMQQFDNDGSRDLGAGSADLVQVNESGDDVHIEIQSGVLNLELNDLPNLQMIVLPANNFADYLRGKWQPNLSYTINDNRINSLEEFITGLKFAFRETDNNQKIAFIQFLNALSKVNEFIKNGNSHFPELIEEMDANSANFMQQLMPVMNSFVPFYDALPHDECCPEGYSLLVVLKDNTQMYVCPLFKVSQEILEKINATRKDLSGDIASGSASLAQLGTMLTTINGALDTAFDSLGTLVTEGQTPEVAAKRMALVNCGRGSSKICITGSALAVVVCIALWYLILRSIELNNTMPGA